HDDFRDRGGRARDRPLAVTAGGRISARPRKTKENVGVAHEPAAGGDKMSWSDRLLHIHIAARASAQMEALDKAKPNEGRGIEGDRYVNGIGTYSPKPDAREVTLTEMEVLDAIARGDPPFPGDKVEVAPGEHRRNLTTLGVPLHHLVGKRFRVGEAVLIGGREEFPCQQPHKTPGPPVLPRPPPRSALP